MKSLKVEDGSSYVHLTSVGVYHYIERPGKYFFLEKFKSEARPARFFSIRICFLTVYLVYFKYQNQLNFLSATGKKRIPENITHVSFIFRLISGKNTKFC